MVYSIIISPTANREIEIAESYFRAENINHEFLMDLNAQLEFLKQMPLSRQLKYRKIRIHLFEKFNYSIHYIVVNDTVRILRILNQKQDF